MVISLLLVASLWGLESVAQELSPRTYWPAPTGTRVLVAGYSYAEGAVIFDPSTPLYSVDSKINAGLVAYLQTLDLWGRSSNIVVELPYAWGETKGLVGETPADKDFSGFADVGVTMTVNLVGAPAMTAQDFLAFRADPKPILGTSLKIVPPSGRYDPDGLVNTGSNRWAARAQLGSVLPIWPSWLLEMNAGVWYFGDNDEFLAGELEQDPIYSAKANLIKRFRPGFWASLDFTYFQGGRQTLDGNRLEDVQSNTKLGVTLVIPFGGRHAIKLGYADGTKTRFGEDFDQWLVAYQVLLP